MSVITQSPALAEIHRSYLEMRYSMERATVSRLADRNEVAPAIVVIVVAVVAFLALAVVIGAFAAYIYYCQKRGLWPALDAPIRSGGTFKLYCTR